MSRDFSIFVALASVLSVWEFWRLWTEDKEMQVFRDEQVRLERLAREAGAIEALEKLSCSALLPDGEDCNEAFGFHPATFDRYACPRCKALAKLREEA